MCIFYFLNSNVFFAFAIIEYKKFRRPGIFFSPWGKKISWSALASAWEDFLLFLGGEGGWGARRLMRRPVPTTLFLFAFVSSSSGNLYATHSQSGGLGSTEVNEKSSTYHAVSICILLLDTLCVRNYVNLLLGSTTQSIRGMGSKGGNEKSSTYHAVSICILLLDTLCVRNYVNLLLSRRRSINMLML